MKSGLMIVSSFLICVFGLEYCLGECGLLRRESGEAVLDPFLFELKGDDRCGRFAVWWIFDSCEKGMNDGISLGECEGE